MPDQDSSTRLIPLTRGQFAIVDAEDYAFLMQWKWSACRSKGGGWYAKRAKMVRGNSRTINMQSVILAVPDGFIVDHRDGNGLNNRRSNLRQATYQQNKCNQKISSRNSSGFKGVHWHKRQKQWVARITVYGRTIDLGGYKHKEIAAQVYVEAAEEYHGEFARPGTPNIFDNAEITQDQSMSQQSR